MLWLACLPFFFGESNWNRSQTRTLQNPKPDADLFYLFLHPTNALPDRAGTGARQDRLLISLTLLSIYCINGRIVF